MEKPLTVAICGGGNGAHCLAGLAASRDKIDVRVLTLYRDEAKLWSDAMKSNNFTVEIDNKDSTKQTTIPKPFLVTDDPKTAFCSVDIIFISIPAFAHEQYLQAISEHLKVRNILIVGLPGQTGFEFQCKNILTGKLDFCTIVSFETLPWACRIVEFGQRIEILGTKKELWISVLQGKNFQSSDSAIENMYYIIGRETALKKLPNYLAGNLMSKTMAHPAIMYGKWKKWNSQPLVKIPLFYQGIDEIQAEFMLKASKEVVATAREIQQQRPEVDMSAVTDIFVSILEYYDDTIGDKSNLMVAMRTNSAYEGLLHPMKCLDPNKYVPDFDHRYLSEDVPFGLVVLKGIAEIAGVATPVIDEILAWCQEKLGKSYIIGSKLTGDDVKSTRAPQSYGMNTLDELLNL